MAGAWTYWRCAHLQLIGAACAMVLMGSALAREPSIESHSTVLRSQTLDSRVLGRPFAFSIYLPPGYDAVAGGRYPLLYLLHGTDGDENDWLDHGHLADTADRLIHEGRIRPMIVVMPAGGNGWYVDNPDRGGEGLWAKAFTEELIPAIDARFETLPVREERGIGGLSMGGYGAVHLALSRPDLFTVIVSLSGALFLPDQPLSSEDVIDLHGAFGRPFDRARFEALNVFALIPRLAAAASSPAIYLASGDRDSFDLDQNTALFYVALKRAGIVSILHIRKGAHDWPFWASEAERVLRFASKHFAPADTPGIASVDTSCADPDAGEDACPALSH